MTWWSVIVAVAGGTVLAVLFAADPTLAMGSTFTLFCLAYAAIVSQRAHRRHLFAPPVLVLLYMGVGIGVKGLLNLYTFESKLAGSLDATAALSRDLLFRVFLYGLVGAVCFVLGDFAGGGLRADGSSHRPVGAIPRQRMIAVLWFGTVLTILAGLALIAKLGMNVISRPSFGSVLNTAGLFWLFPLLYGGIYAWSLAIINDWSERGYARRLHVLGLIVVVIFVFLLTSSKASMLTAVIIIFVARHYSVRPMPGKVLVGTAVAFLVLLPMLYLHRAYGLGGGFLSHFQPKILLTGFMLFINRSYLADSLGAILLYTPAVYNFQFGKPWLELFYFWIPRGLWPDKPLSAGYRFGETYLSSYPEAGHSFFTVSLVGDGYLNFGVVGIIVLMSVLGFSLRLFYDRLVGARPRVWGVFLYAATVYPIAISAEQNLATFLTLAASYLAIATLIAFCAYSRLQVREPAIAGPDGGVT